MRGEERRRGGREEKRIERRIAATFVDRHTHTNYEACSAMSTHQLIFSSWTAWDCLGVVLLATAMLVPVHGRLPDTVARRRIMKSLVTTADS